VDLHEHQNFAFGARGRIFSEGKKLNFLDNVWMNLREIKF
jgi:hypothetical protein